MWLLPYVVTTIGCVVGAVCLLLVGVFGWFGYREFMSHREAVIPAWGPRRFLIIALLLGGAFALRAELTVPAFTLWGVALLVVLPTIINTPVVAVRAVQAFYLRRAGQVYNPLSAVHQRYHDAHKIPEPRVMNVYSWVVPTQEMLDLVAAQAPIVEVGAGTGYVAWLLRQMGVDIIAYDAMPGPCIGNRHHVLNLSWTHVRKGDAEGAADRHSDRTLMLCWPPAEIDMSYRALCAYKGDRVIYIGARGADCGMETGHHHFHDALERDWVLVEKVKVKSWSNSYTDHARVLRRKTAEEKRQSPSPDKRRS